MLVTRLLYGVDRLSLNNEVAGFKFAVIGVFYAVMLAFVVIAVWEEFRKTEAAVRDEAKAVVDLHRVTFALPVEGGAEIREHLIAYTKDVREHEWPTMAVGEPSDVVVKDLDQLSQAIFGVNPATSQELALYQDALRLLALMTDNRNERLDSADGSVPRVLWFVLIVGGLITLGYPAFFGSTNLVAQVLMTGGAGRAGRARHAARPCLRLSLHRRRADLARPVRTGLAPNAVSVVSAVKHWPLRDRTSRQDVIELCIAGAGGFAPCAPALWRDGWTRRNRWKRRWPKPSARRMPSRVPSTSGCDSISANCASCFRTSKAPTTGWSSASRPMPPRIRVPAIGDKLPGFFMTDSEGQLVDLDSLLAKGPLVISFNRGPWCDYCGLELRALARAYPDIAAAGGDVVSIVPETAKYAKTLKQARKLPFRVLTDLDLAYALSLGLVFWVGERSRTPTGSSASISSNFRAMGAGCCRSRRRSWSAGDGRVKARFVDPDFRHRMGMETILGAARPSEVRRNPPSPRDFLPFSRCRRCFFSPGHHDHGVGALCFCG